MRKRRKILGVSQYIDGGLIAEIIVAFMVLLCSDFRNLAGDGYYGRRFNVV